MPRLFRFSFWLFSTRKAHSSAALLPKPYTLRTDRRPFCKHIVKSAVAHAQDDQRYSRNQNDHAQDPYPAGAFLRYCLCYGFPYIHPLKSGRFVLSLIPYSQDPSCHGKADSRGDQGQEFQKNLMLGLKCQLISISMILLMSAMDIIW